MKLKKKIAVVTGTRAEYGILKPLLNEIIKSPCLELKLLVSGMHLLPQFGLTINEIKNDGFDITRTVKLYDKKVKNNSYYSESLARGIRNFSHAFHELKPDITVVFGDRIEALAAALASATMRIPLAHIHGGDKTDDGHIDESIRNSISQFAHIHFTATKSHSQRLIRFGEQPWRIIQVGALGLDSIVDRKPISKKILFKKLGLEDQKTLVCLFHPVNAEEHKKGKIMNTILESIRELKIQSVVIYPNNDSGNLPIIKEIKKFSNLPFIRIFPSLAHSEYLSLLHHSDVLVGNSSSGMIETPSIGIPVVNIGLRNRGREHGQNILFVDINKKNIIKAINKALFNSDFIKKSKRGKNPYGDGNSSGRITSTLCELILNERLLRKIPTR